MLLAVRHYLRYLFLCHHFPFHFFDAKVTAWNSLANTQKGKSVLGTSSKISGVNLYSRLNFWIVKAGGTALSTPPVLVGVDAPCEADLSLTADQFTFQLPDPPAVTTDLKLVIMVSAPQSNGVTRAYSKAVMIGSPKSVVDTAIDLKASIDLLSSENRRLLADITAVNAEIVAVRKENEELKASVDRLCAENAQLQEEVRQLREQIKRQK